MKYLIVCVIASAGLLLDGCAGTKTVASRTSTTSTPPPGPVTVSSAAPGSIGAGTMLVVRTSEAISTVQDAPGKTYSADTIGDIVDQGSTTLVPKGSRVQLIATASPGGTPAQ